MHIKTKGIPNLTQNKFFPFDVRNSSLAQAGKLGSTYPDASWERIYKHCGKQVSKLNEIEVVMTQFCSLFCQKEKWLHYLGYSRDSWLSLLSSESLQWRIKCGLQAMKADKILRVELCKVWLNQKRTRKHNLPLNVQLTCEGLLYNALIHRQHNAFKKNDIRS